MLLSLVWVENCPVAYSLFPVLSRRGMCENARRMAVMRNVVAKFFWLLELKERSRFLKKAAQKLS
jgi:hypothetical protein